MKRFIKLVTASVALLATQAYSATFYIDQSNALANDVNYAQVDITASGDDINFMVSVISSAFSVTGSNFGMQTFSFNYDTALTVGTTNIIDVDPATWSLSQDANAGGGFGKFEFALAGNGSSRTEVLSFSISGVAGDTVDSYAIGSTLNPSSGEFFATHIAGFDLTDGVTSAQFAGSTAVVPVPAAAWLFGSGLIGLVGLARRRA
jgi:hypothetical protein